LLDSALEREDFCAQTFHKAVWRRDWWDILLSIYYRFTAKSISDRIWKIVRHLAKL